MKWWAFVLHRYYQHEGYDTPENVVYTRSLSINEKYQGFGYGTKIMMSLPQYVQGVFPDFNHLYLVVDAEMTMLGTYTNVLDPCIQRLKKKDQSAKNDYITWT